VLLVAHVRLLGGATIVAFAQVLIGS